MTSSAHDSPTVGGAAGGIAGPACPPPLVASPLGGGGCTCPPNQELYEDDATGEQFCASPAVGVLGGPSTGGDGVTVSELLQAECRTLLQCRVPASDCAPAPPELDVEGRFCQCLLPLQPLFNGKAAACVKMCSSAEVTSIPKGRGSVTAKKCCGDGGRGGGILHKIFSLAPSLISTLAVHESNVGEEHTFTVQL